MWRAASQNKSGLQLTSDPVMGTFVFPEAWNNLPRFDPSSLPYGNTRSIQVSDQEAPTYEADAINAAHDLGLSFYAGIACFSDHARDFDELARRPELWPIIETGERRPQMEWYVGVSPTDRIHQEKTFATISSMAEALDRRLFLDFVRWPVHLGDRAAPRAPAPTRFSFDETTLTLFAETLGLELPLTHLSSASARAA